MIRSANIDDVAHIMQIVHSAQQALAELGIDQWQDGYPSKDVIERDISNGVGYVYTDIYGTPIGYVAIVLSGEQAYTQIPDNEWHTDSNYVVVHRLCVNKSARRTGIAVALMSYAAKYARSNGVTAFRIDTHSGNTRMLTMMQRLGFEYTGVVRYDSGERMAFDLNLNMSKSL